MNFVPGGRLFLLVLLPTFSARANLNLGDSPWREISLGLIADVRATVQPVGDSFRAWSSVNSPEIISDRVEVDPGELSAGEEGPGDEPYFGSATWSEVSKPRMVDFSFGQPCGPLLWWESSETEPLTVVPASKVVPLPKMTFDWGNLRPSVNSSREATSTNAGMAILPFSLLGVLGLVFRRG